MLSSRELPIPLPVVWNPPGPFNVEVDEGFGFDAVALEPDLLTAARKASRILKRDWLLHRDSRRVRLEGPGGVW